VSAPACTVPLDPTSRREAISALTDLLLNYLRTHGPASDGSQEAPDATRPAA
jgi:hypothetical protein